MPRVVCAALLILAQAIALAKAPFVLSGNKPTRLRRPCCCGTPPENFRHAPIADATRAAKHQESPLIPAQIYSRRATLSHQMPAYAHHVAICLGALEASSELRAWASFACVIECVTARQCQDCAIRPHCMIINCPLPNHAPSRKAKLQRLRPWPSCNDLNWIYAGSTNTASLTRSALSFAALTNDFHSSIDLTSGIISTLDGLVTTSPVSSTARSFGIR